jgi:hypothetical protein
LPPYFFLFFLLPSFLLQLLPLPSPPKNTTMKKTQQGDLKRELPFPLLFPLCCYNNYYNYFRWLHGSAITTPLMQGGNMPPCFPFSS